MPTWLEMCFHVRAFLLRSPCKWRLMSYSQGIQTQIRINAKVQLGWTLDVSAPSLFFCGVKVFCSALLKSVAVQCKPPEKSQEWPWHPHNFMSPWWQMSTHLFYRELDVPVEPFCCPGSRDQNWPHQQSPLLYVSPKQWLNLTSHNFNFTFSETTLLRGPFQCHLCICVIIYVYAFCSSLLTVSHEPYHFLRY